MKFNVSFMTGSGDRIFECVESDDSDKTYELAVRQFCYKNNYDDDEIDYELAESRDFVITPYSSDTVFVAFRSSETKEIFHKVFSSQKAAEKELDKCARIDYYRGYVQECKIND